MTSNETISQQESLGVIEMKRNPQCGRSEKQSPDPQVQRLVEVAVADAGIHERRHLQHLRQRALGACSEFRVYWVGVHCS
jgi:hypothetical protein